MARVSKLDFNGLPICSATNTNPDTLQVSALPWGPGRTIIYPWQKSDTTGVAPGGFLGAPTGTSNLLPTTIQVFFDVAGLNGFPEPELRVAVSLSRTMIPIITSPLATPVPDTDNALYTATITGLTQSTAYYFQAFALNGVSPPLLSPVSLPIFTQLIPAPPSEPLVPTEVETQATETILQISTIGQIGVPFPTMSVIYGISDSPSDPPPTYPNEVQAVKTGPFTWRVLVTGLTPDSYYFFKSRATNLAGTATSDDYLRVDTRQAGPGTPPGIAQFVSSTAALITVKATVPTPPSGIIPESYYGFFGFSPTQVNNPVLPEDIDLVANPGFITARNNLFDTVPGPTTPVYFLIGANYPFEQPSLDGPIGGPFFTTV